MALGGVSITWDETAPANGRNAGLGAGDIRSIQSNLRGALDNEHVYPSSGGTAGGHRAGSVRVFYDTASRVSSTDTDGRLMFTSNTSNLYAVNSATTVLVGGRHAVYGPSSHTAGNELLITSKVTQHWHLEVGQHSLATLGSVSYLTFVANFASAPIVVLTPYIGDQLTFSVIPTITATNQTIAQVITYNTTSGASGPAPVGSLVNYLAAGYVANG